MAKIPTQAVQAAAEALAAHFNPTCAKSWEAETRADLTESWETEARIALVAALPHLQPVRKPRMACPVCRKDVVRRDDGKPITHYAKNNNPQFTCKGDMFSHCRGGCRCAKHR